ncbi:MAG: phosphoribosylglycinamide formyltransferase [Pseudomonadota bacterium]
MRVGVLLSGRGSNLAALIEACEDPEFPAEITLVVSNKEDAGGLERARKAGIAAVAIDHRPFESREAHEAKIDSCLKEHQIELVCLAGYMRILTDTLVSRWTGKMINIHPSLLPLFKGLDTHQRALVTGVKLHGCSVHFVNGELDGGAIIAQGAVPVRSDDDADSLADRVLIMEHRLYPHALGLVAAGKACLVGGKTQISADAETSLMDVPA